MNETGGISLNLKDIWRSSPSLKSDIVTCSPVFKCLIRASSNSGLYSSLLIATIRSLAYIPALAAGELESMCWTFANLPVVLYSSFIPKAKPGCGYFPSES